MGRLSWRRFVVYQRMVGRLEAEEQLQWLMILKTEGKQLQPLINDLRARAGEAMEAPPRKRRREQGKAVTDGFITEYQMNMQGVRDGHKEPGIVTGDRTAKQLIKERWLAEARQIAAAKRGLTAGSPT